MSLPRYWGRTERVLELREPPGAPAGVSGAYCDEGVPDRTVGSFCEQDEGLIV